MKFWQWGLLLVAIVCMWEEESCRVCRGTNSPGDSVGGGREDDPEDVDDETRLTKILTDAQAKCKIDKIIDDTNKDIKIDTPKYVRDFGVRLGVMLDDHKGFKPWPVIKECRDNLSDEDKKHLNAEIRKMVVAEMDIQQERIKSNAKGEVKPLTKDEREEEIKARCAKLDAPIKFIEALTQRLFNVNQEITFVYFSAAYNLINDVIKFTAAKVSSPERVKHLVEIKNAVEVVSNGSAPFFKQTWFIITMVIFGLGLIVVAVFIALSLRKPPK